MATATTKTDDSGIDKIPVGQCPTDGYVTGDDVDERWPAPAKCGVCGQVLTAVTMATPDEVQAHITNDD